MAGKGLIVLVMDEPDDEAMLVRFASRAHLGNDLVVVRDGVEAVEYLLAAGSHADRPADEFPDLVLLDVRLPRLGGLEVLARIRSVREARRLPVAMLTDSDEDEARLRALGLTDVAYLRKPVGFPALVEAAARLGLSLVLCRDAEERIEASQRRVKTSLEHIERSLVRLAESEDRAQSREGARPEA
jgi:two-component system response regulator